jgi:chromate transporter
VVAVVVHAGLALGRTSVAGRGATAVAYLLAGAAATLLVGAAVVLVLLACGLAELARRRARGDVGGVAACALPAAAALAATGAAALPALAWTALKVGALSYGGGFVIVPLMQADAVGQGWMTDAEFASAVAFGQLTPGPVVQTVGVVGYAAAGLGGGLLAAAVAFAPSFLVVGLGARRFARLRASATARAFLDGAGPAAVGAILGAAVPLLQGVQEAWQWAVLAAAAVALLALRLGVVPVLLAAAAVGALVRSVG